MQLLKSLMLLFAFTSLFGGCNHNEVPAALPGDWRWEGSSGGLAGMIIKPTAGERVILRFTADKRFEVYQNDTLTFSGTFQLTKAQSIYSGKEESSIETGQVKASNQVKNVRYIVTKGIITTLSGSQLTIADNFYDGFASGFVRN